MSTPLPASIPADPRAEFGNFKRLNELFGITRSTAYLLEKANEIRFARLRRRGRLTSTVLVDFDSVRTYLAKCAETQPEA